jgi:hypothetical protein
MGRLRHLDGHWHQIRTRDVPPLALPLPPAPKRAAEVAVAWPMARARPVHPLGGHLPYIDVHERAAWIEPAARLREGSAEVPKSPLGDARNREVEGVPAYVPARLPREPPNLSEPADDPNPPTTEVITDSCDQQAEPGLWKLDRRRFGSVGLIAPVHQPRERLERAERYAALTIPKAEAHLFGTGPQANETRLGGRAPILWLGRAHGGLEAGQPETLTDPQATPGPDPVRARQRLDGAVVVPRDVGERLAGTNEHDTAVGHPQHLTGPDGGGAPHPVRRPEVRHAHAITPSDARQAVARAHSVLPIGRSHRGYDKEHRPDDGAGQDVTEEGHEGRVFARAWERSNTHKKAEAHKKAERRRR